MLHTVHFLVCFAILNVGCHTRQGCELFGLFAYRLKALLPAATKLGQGNIFTSVCQEFCPHGGEGVCLSAWWDTHPPGADTPGPGRHPPGPGRPPGSRHHPRGQTPPPTRDQADTPREQTPPQEADSSIRSTNLFKKHLFKC